MPDTVLPAGAESAAGGGAAFEVRLARGNRAAAWPPAQAATAVQVVRAAPIRSLSV
jgi:hypothetical protein